MHQWVCRPLVSLKTVECGHAHVWHEQRSCVRVSCWLLPNALFALATAHHHVQNIVNGVFIVAMAGGVHLVQEALCLLARAARCLVDEQGRMCVGQHDWLGGDDGPQGLVQFGFRHGGCPLCEVGLQTN